MNAFKNVSLIVIIGLLALAFSSCKQSSSGEGSNAPGALLSVLEISEAPTLYVVIDKTADQSEVILSLGQAITVNYTITVDILESAPAEGCYLPLDYNQCIYVTDSYNGEFSERICYEQGIGSYDFTYSRQIGPYEECGFDIVSNTACVQYNPTVTPEPCCVTYDIYVEVPCGDGCTLTPGYWKTHSMYGPAPYDDTWDLVDEDAPFYGNTLSWYEMLWAPPKGGNAYIILAHAYIAAYLNDLNGASMPSVVVEAMANAEHLLSTYTMNSSLSKTVRNSFIAYAELLDDYNNGYIGPGHCSE